MSLLQNSNAVTPSAGYDIDNSCRFNEPDSPYLSRTPASASNRKTWTISCWVKLTGHDNAVYFMDAGSNPNYTVVNIYSGQLLIYDPSVAPDSIYIKSTDLFRDPASWYHVVVQLDTTQATNTDRVKLYVNNRRIDSFANTTWPALNYDGFINNNIEHTINKSGGEEGAPYMAEYHFIDGTALTPSSFGEADEDTNEWKAIKYDGSYGTNGFFLEFKNSAALGTDTSGEGNTWASTNLVATDQMIDTPTNNFATLNPLQSVAGGYNYTMSEGNLKNTVTTGGLNWPSTFAVPNLDQKWYWEHYNISGGSVKGLSIILNYDFTSSYENSAAYYYRWQGDSGIKKSVLNTGAETTANGTLLATGDIGAVFVNGADLQFYKNGSLVYTATDACSVSEGCNIIIPGGYGSDNTVWAQNYGQDSSFAGEKTSGSANATDANGIGDFYYTPPAGALAFCTKNLSDPSIALPAEHFNTVLYTGTGVNPHAITGVGFQPDLVWTKARTKGAGNGGNHWLTDALRGVTKELKADGPEAEGTDLNGVVAFGADGFSVGLGGFNYLNDLFIGWNWKAGGTPTVDNSAGAGNVPTAGSVKINGANSGAALAGSIAATRLSANTTNGFSTVKYEGNNTSGATVGHGLSKTPELIILKNLEASVDWVVYSEPVGPTKGLQLNGTGDAYDYAAYFNDTSPTASVFSLGNYSGVNANTEDMIAYCFHSIEGYSKVGTYKGNGDTGGDGPFIFTDFSPAYVLIKRTDAAASWAILNNKSPGYNVINNSLYASDANAETTGAGVTSSIVDFVSNGIKVRGYSSNVNNSSGTYIYLAFAESPFKYSRAR